MHTMRPVGGGGEREAVNGAGADRAMNSAACFGMAPRQQAAEQGLAPWLCASTSSSITRLAQAAGRLEQDGREEWSPGTSTGQNNHTAAVPSCLHHESGQHLNVVGVIVVRSHAPLPEQDSYTSTQVSQPAASP